MTPLFTVIRVSMGLLMLLADNFEKFRVMSINRLLLLVSLTIVVIDNNTLWSTFWAALGEHPVSHLVFLLSFLIMLVTITLLLLSLFGFYRIIKPVAIVALMLSAIIGYHIDNMHVIFSVSMLRNVFETDVREASELINTSVLLHVLVFGFLPSVFVWFVKVERKPVSSEMVSRIKLLSVMLLVSILTIFWTSKEYAFVLRENRSMRYMVNPVYPVVSLFKYVKSTSGNSNKVILPVFNDAVRQVNVGGKVRKDILIVVVGETARADKFSLNGYDRDTNPLLRKENIVNFSNTSSCGTATAESVPCMFSDLTHDNFNTEKAKQRENVLDGFKHAGIDVLWRENNSSCKGVCARVVSEDLANMKVKELCNDEECYDEILLYRLDEYIKNLQQDAVIVLHQKGSHGPAYYKRYPARFAKFTPECNDSSVHNCNLDEIVNAYDNTILYSDYFLSRIIAFLKARSDEFNTAMMYMSDHGESLGENGVYLHGLPYFMAPQEQTHVPFIVWLSESMRRQKHINTECLLNNSRRSYSHDNLVHSALGLMDVSTMAYEQSKDVFAGCRTSSLAQYVQKTASSSL